MSARKALVPIKRVVDYAVKVNVKPDHTGIDLSSVKMSMNPFCAIALEAALRLRESSHLAHVTALTIGPASFSDTARVALAMGADRAVHVVVPETADELPPLAVARVVGEVVRREGAELVFMGKQSIDGDHNQTGQMLAGMLDWPQVRFCRLGRRMRLFHHITTVL